LTTTLKGGNVLGVKILIGVLAAWLLVAGIEAEAHLASQNQKDSHEIVVARGRASYYTQKSAPSQYTKSGEKFSDKKLTLAVLPEVFEKYKNAYVKVVNLTNGLWVEAKVNDTGGFGKYDRVADVSLAVKEGIKLKTDQLVLITVLRMPEK
jgi:rare lipoprotein A (peptidoglycan hydrolase)